MNSWTTHNEEVWNVKEQIEGLEREKVLAIAKYSCPRARLPP